MIDPKAKVRAIMYYPLSNGRNMDEIKRLWLVMQKPDAENVATPEQTGYDVISPYHQVHVELQRIELNLKKKGKYCLDWFMRFRKQ